MDPRRRIPAVETLLEAEALAPLAEAAGRGRLAAAIRTVQSRIRERLDRDPSLGDQGIEEPGWWAEPVREELGRAGPLGEVVNATGVVLHTNLGRAPLAETARDAVVAASGYLALEYDLEEGRRGSRYDHCTGLLRSLTGAEAALVVNNNAAALVLALNTLGRGGAAVISRGELVEIGGSFRVPEIMERSGVAMREVGATNRTHERDYRDALPGAAVLLKVHRSNFRLEGFVAEVEPAVLAGLAREAGLPFLHDLGSGALVDLTPAALPPEPTARQALAEGADVVTMSGDKLLGGPQAGILLGRADLIDRMRANPLCRAFRPDKLTLAALEATLGLYRDDQAWSEVPVLRMLAAGPDALRGRAERLASRLAAKGAEVEVVEAPAAVGGGSYPGVTLPGFAVAVRTAGSADALARALRLGSPPVVGQIRDERLLLHLRTLPPDREAVVAAAVADALAELERGSRG